MDINYLLYREQIERFRAAAAPAGAGRMAHCDMADAYRAMLDGHRVALLHAAAPGSNRQPARL